MSRLVATLHCKTYILCLKNIPDIFDCNLKTNYLILIIFGTNIPNAICHVTLLREGLQPVL